MELVMALWAVHLGIHIGLGMIMLFAAYLSLGPITNLTTMHCGRSSVGWYVRDRVGHTLKTWEILVLVMGGQPTSTLDNMPISSPMSTLSNSAVITSFGTSNFRDPLVTGILTNMYRNG